MIEKRGDGSAVGQVDGGFAEPVLEDAEWENANLHHDLRITSQEN